MYTCKYVCKYILICTYIKHRFKDVWSYAQALDSAGCWNELAEAALYHLDVDLGKLYTYMFI